MVATKKVLKPWVKVVIVLLVLTILGGIGYYGYQYIQNLPTIEKGTISEVEIDEEAAPESELEEGEYITSNEELKLVVIDVGNGQSLLFDYGSCEVLIDGGYPEEGEKVIKEIKPYVDGKIEYCIATHSDADHTGGLAAVYKEFDVERTIYGNLDTENKACMNFYNAAKAESEVSEDTDTVIELGKNCSITIFDVLDGAQEPNNNSVITLVEYGETTFFASGDAEEEAEVLLNGKLPQECNVVVAGHHGSSTSNTLLSQLAPDMFVVSAGKGNDYGHPHKEVLEQAIDLGCEVYGTFKHGTITFTSDGLNVSCDVNAENQLTVKDAGAN